MARLELRFLGPFHVALAGEPVTTFESVKVRALLATLAAEAPRPQPRERLAGLLWPGWPQKSAMSNLRYALADLRKNIHDREAQPPFLLITRESIQLNPEGDVWMDVAEFERLSAISRQLSAVSSQPSAISNRPNVVREKSAIDLYRGEFLEGFVLNDSPAFEEWTLAKREYFKQRALGALHTLAEEARQRGEYEQALAYARRQLELEPWQEEAHRQIMHLLAVGGQRSAALAQFEACRRLLKDELGVDPAEETAQLYEQIRGGTLAAWPSPPAFLQTGEPKEPEPPPFVARQTELSRLMEALERALAGKGQVLFVTGSPGRGKTALVHEFIYRSLEAHPVLVAAVGNCQAYFGMGDPYLPFREALEMLTGQVEERWAAGTITQAHASRLWHFTAHSVKALVEEGPALVDTFLTGPPLLQRAAQAVQGEPAWLQRLQEIVQIHQKSTFATAAGQEDLIYQYNRLLRRLSRQSPLLVFLDDLQWADPDSLSLLFTLGRQIAGSPILIVGAYRPEEILAETDASPHPLAAILNELQLLYGDLRIDLDEAEDRLFVDAILDREPNRLGLPFREILFRQTRGHALFTIELLRDMQARGDLLKDQAGEWVESPGLRWDVLPARVEAAIAQRIGRLPKSLRDLLQIASVEGESFTVEVAAELLGMGTPALLKQLGEELDRQHQLVRAEGLVRIPGRRLSRCRFRHILFQRYVYTNLDPLLRVSLHEQVGGALEQLYGEQAGEVAGQLARHFEEAGLPEKAIPYLAQAGERATRLAANEEAVAYYSRALELTPEADLAGRFELLMAREKVYHRTGQRQAEGQDIQDLEALAVDLGAAQQAEAALRRCYLASDTNHRRLVESAQPAIAWAQAAGRIDLEAEGYFIRYVLIAPPSPTPDAIAHVEQALALARQAGLKRLEADILREAALFYLADPRSERDLAGQALQIYHSLGDRYGEGRALDVIGQALSGLGDYAGALSAHEQARQADREVGNRFDEVFPLMGSAKCLLSLGCLERLADLYAPLLDALEITQELGHGLLMAMVPRYLSVMAWLQGDHIRALAFAELALERSLKWAAGGWWAAAGWGFGVTEEWVGLTLVGLIQAELGRPEQAAGAFHQAVGMVRESKRVEFLHVPLAGLARLAFVRGEVSQALACVEEFLPYQEETITPTQDFFSFCSFWSTLTCYQVFQANSDPRAGEVLSEAYRRLQERAALIIDEDLRRSFLENVPWHREIVALWEAAQAGKPG